MRIRYSFTTLLISAVFAFPAGASELAIIAASVVPGDFQVPMQVHPGVDVQLSIPNPSLRWATEAWTVEIDDDRGAISGTNVTSVDISRVNTGHVFLQLPDSLSLPLRGWAQVYVTYNPGGPKTYRFLGKRADKPKRIVGADSKESADVYVSGSYSPRIGSPAQYTYDVAIGYGLPYFNKKNPALGRIGFSVTGAADQRPNLDPDSYYAGTFWQAYPVRKPHGPFQGAVFQLDVGGELTRKKLGAAKTKTSNFLAPAPRFEFPLRLYPLPGHSAKGVFVSLRPIVGFDWGRNFQNASQADGSGVMARSVAGADFSLTGKPKSTPFLHSLSVSSSWRGRYPWRKEIDTTSKYDPTNQDFDYSFGLTTKPRNHIGSKLDWKWTEYFGLTVSHELGAQPPLFNYIDHSVTIGFTFSGSFAKDGVQRRQ